MEFQLRVTGNQQWKAVTTIKQRKFVTRFFSVVENVPKYLGSERVLSALLT